MKPALAAAIVAGLAAAVPAHAQIEAGDVLVRARAIVVTPTERSGPVEPAFPGAEVGVGNAVMPEVDFTYMFTDNIGAELIVSSTKHAVTGRGDLDALGEVASTWVLPPTLTLQYHFNSAGHVRPYLGAGVNYTTFYSGKASDSLEAAIGDTKVSMKDSFGYALQAGVDVGINKTFFLNLDVKYVDIDTTARLNTGGSINRVRVNIDPIISSVGIGVRF
jgi:outer membrane protein